MAVFLRIDINIVAIVLLGIVFFIARLRLDRKDTVNSIYLNVSWIILLELFFETVTCVINRRPELWLVPISNAFHICLFAAGPILTYYWFIFIRGMVLSETPAKTRHHVLLLAPVAVNAVMAFLSPAFRLIFYISSDNVYHRGPLFIASAAVIYFYLLLGFVLIIKNRRKIIRQDFLPLLFFGILPALGGLFQTIFYGTLLMWSSTAFSLIIVYIFLEERMVHLDYLTGSWNRCSFDAFISQRISQKSGEKLGIIYMDIDGLKHINDDYGHAEGDAVLKEVIRLIKSTIRHSDIVARLGGDEFAVVLTFEDGEREILNHTIVRIEDAMAAYNRDSGKPYTLRCSFGADVFCPESCSLEQFMHGIDMLMYNSKKQKKPE